MSYCTHCHVEIKDPTETCPLCRHVLKAEEHEDSGEYTFPDAMGKKRKLYTWVRVLAFLAVAVSAVSIFINYTSGSYLSWSLIVVGSLLYALWILSLSVREAGYIHQIFVMVIGAVALVCLIDFVTGYHRWSVNYVLPGSMLLVDLTFIILMIVNRRNWQGYMLYQILMILIAIIPIVLIKTGVVTKPLVSEIAVLSAILVFLGTLILGGGVARTELKRRFHV